jgi:ribosomal protein S18 acetylase RimI-like enzyme
MQLHNQYCNSTSIGKLQPSFNKSVPTVDATTDRKDTLDFEMETPARNDSVEAAWQGLKDCNMQSAGASDFVSFSISIRTPRQRVVGVLLAELYWGWMHICIVWIHEEYRHQGLARKLLQRAELKATEQQCHHAYLDTFSFQATSFYKDLGYKIVGQLDDFPLGHQRFFMMKPLTVHNA